MGVLVLKYKLHLADRYTDSCFLKSFRLTSNLNTNTLKTQTLRLFILFVFISPALSCSSQTSKSKITEEEFKKFDANESGWLSGKELIACNCKNYDGNGDNEITKEEFFAGKGTKMPGNVAVAEVNQAKQKPQANKTEKQTTNGAGTANIKGAWLYTTILYADGKVYELRNRQSNIDLKENGDYYQNTWMGGINNMSTDGKYVVAGSRLTLKPKSGKEEIYIFNLSADGNLLNLKAGDGSGWKLERPGK